MHAQVGILGGGPAGLLLSHLLALEGIDSVVLDARSRESIETTIRAGVLEDHVAELLRETGVGERMDAEGAVHHGIELRWSGRHHRIDFEELTGGRSITLYGQHEVVKDLNKARVEAGGRDHLGGAGRRDRRDRERPADDPLPHRRVHRRGPPAAQRRPAGADL